MQESDDESEIDSEMLETVNTPRECVESFGLALIERISDEDFCSMRTEELSRLFDILTQQELQKMVSQLIYRVPPSLFMVNKLIEIIIQNATKKHAIAQQTNAQPANPSFKRAKQKIAPELVLDVSHLEVLICRGVVLNPRANQEVDCKEPYQTLVDHMWKNRFPVNPLHYACNESWIEPDSVSDIRAQIIRILVRAGTDPNLPGIFPATQGYPVQPLDGVQKLQTLQV
jgi:hypothetical protein